jgi:hypothetical protein
MVSHCDGTKYGSVSHAYILLLTIKLLSHLIPTPISLQKTM